MTERPILFSGEMVRAILAGTKTQTRRPLKVRNLDVGPFDFARIDAAHMADGLAQIRQDDIDGGALFGAVRCPFGVVGDRLWCKETWVRAWSDSVYRAPELRRLDVRYRADGTGPEPARWTPSIHMPRWASRLTLDVTGVRVERVQDISEDDARAEGFADRAALLATWAGIYGEGDPWVWVVSFKRVEG